MNPAMTYTLTSTLTVMVRQAFSHDLNPGKHDGLHLTIHN
jgi:hypothetical protein